MPQHSVGTVLRFYMFACFLVAFMLPWGALSRERRSAAGTIHISPNGNSTFIVSTWRFAYTLLFNDLCIYNHNCFQKNLSATNSQKCILVYTQLDPALCQGDGR